MQNNVVAHFTDGRVIKGTSLDAQPGKPICHIKTDEGMIEVAFRDLKALYFVKDLNGNPGYRETTEPDAADMRLRGSRQLKIKFRDGEEMVGLTTGDPKQRPYFFAMPVDEKSNNLRILVNRDAVRSIGPNS